MDALSYYEIIIFKISFVKHANREIGRKQSEFSIKKRIMINKIFYHKFYSEILKFEFTQISAFILTFFNLNENDAFAKGANFLP